MPKILYNISILRLTLPFIILIIVFQNSAFANNTDKILAKVDIKSSISEISLPVYAHLKGTSDQDYALVIASESELIQSDHTYQILEKIPNNMKGTNYLICLERIDGAIEEAASQFDILLDDGRYLIVRVTMTDAEHIVQLGFEIEWLSEQPIVIAQFRQMMTFSSRDATIDHSRDVAQMMDRVTETKASDYISGLTGETDVIVGDEVYNISTRHTNSGEYIEKATQYVYEFMQKKGLSVSYHDWTTADRYGSTISGRNVIGELTGSVFPEEIILVTAHLDCEPYSIDAPGADDNGSGSAAVMIIAELFATRTFEKTIRFVFFTGEEQGLLGSREYADDIVNGENIVGVYNMDMIAWDDDGEPVLRIHTRTASNPGYSGDLEIANTFIDVVTTYDLSSVLTPVIDPDGISASDHSSFWNKGIPAVLAIEDDVNDFNDNYHTSNDRLSTLNLGYFSSYIKASLGVAAHLATIVDKPKIDITPILPLLLDE